MSQHVGWDRTEPTSSLNPQHTAYHPRWHRERIPIFWWVRNRRYTTFIIRELTSVMVVYSAVLLLVTLVAVGRGPESYAAFLDWLVRPWVLALHVVMLAGLIFHSVTWLNLAPRALVLRVAGRRVPDRVILLGHYGAWLGISVLIVLGVVQGLG